MHMLAMFLWSAGFSMCNFMISIFFCLSLWPGGAGLNHPMLSLRQREAFLEPAGALAEEEEQGTQWADASGTAHDGSEPPL